MTNSTHLVNNRSYTINTSLDDAFSLESNKNYFFDLDYLQVLALSGKDVDTFLQGQISCDVREISNNTMRSGAFCNLKGRVIALADVLLFDGYKLVLPADLMPILKKTLSKVALFSRVQLQTDPSFYIAGFYQQNLQDLIPYDIKLPTENHAVLQTKDYCAYSLGNGFYVFLFRNEADYTLSKAQFKAKTQYRGTLAWHALQLQQQRMQIYPDSSELFLPHRLNLDKTGYLNFKKGCYKGQEIIARTEYLAKRKHELVLLKVPLNVVPKVGEPIRNEAQKEIGEWIDYCPQPTYNLALASVQLEAIHDLIEWRFN